MRSVITVRTESFWEVRTPRGVLQEAKHRSRYTNRSTPRNARKVSEACLFLSFMCFFLFVFDTFLDLRVVGDSAEKLPYIESLLDSLVFEVVVEYAGELDSIDHYQHDTGKERNVEFLSECAPDHPGQCDPAYIIHQFVDGPSPLSGRSDHLASLPGCQDSEPGVNDDEYQRQHQERQQP